MRLKVAAVLVGSAALVGCSGVVGQGHPPDQAVIEEFTLRRASYEALAAEAARSPEAISTPVFQGRMRSLGVTMVLRWDRPGSPEVRFVLSSSGGAMETSTKGLAYSRVELAPQLASLDGPVVAPDTEGYRRIDDSWHVFVCR